jgi:hypothetical protein
MWHALKSIIIATKEVMGKNIGNNRAVSVAEFFASL